MSGLYDTARELRDRVWAEQVRRFGEWEPADVNEDYAPLGDSQRWWYLQGKCEAYAAIMSELEQAGMAGSCG